MKKLRGWNVRGEKHEEDNRVTLIIIAINILVWMINIATGGGSIWGLVLSGGGYFKEVGEATYPSIFVQGEWWRLLLCGYLHVGIFHLIFNIYALLIVGNKIEKRLRGISSCICYHLGIVVTASIWCLLIKQDSMVGASLGIYVWIGMMFVINRFDKLRTGLLITTRQRRYMISYMVIGCFWGINTIVVHLIGLAIGVLFGGIYIYFEKISKKEEI